MPLPISAQGFIPNPLIKVQGAQAGKSVGSPFANFVEGLAGGAQQGIQIAKGLQELEFAPKEQERKERQTTLAEKAQEQNFEIAQQREERLRNRTEFEQDYKNEMLNIQDRRTRVQEGRLSEQIRRADVAETAKMQNQARNDIASGVIQSTVSRGDFGALTSVLSDNSSTGRRLQESIQESLVRKGQEDAGQAFVNRLQDAIDDNEVDDTTKALFGSFIYRLGFSKHIMTVDEEAKQWEQSQKKALKSFGVFPRDGNRINAKWEKIQIGDDQKRVFRVYQESKQGGRTRRDLLNTYPENMQQEIDAIQIAAGVWNQRINARNAPKEAARFIAEQRAQQQKLPGQQELPAKVSKKEATRSPATRTGLAFSATELGGGGRAMPFPLKETREEKARRRLAEKTE